VLIFYLIDVMLRSKGCARWFRRACEFFTPHPLLSFLFLYSEYVYLFYLICLFLLLTVRLVPFNLPLPLASSMFMFPFFLNP
jgi:hypothetical protein